MAGLAAAAHATGLGASVLVLEKGDRPGGSMRLSSCVVWRYRDFDRYREECPDGDPVLQRLVHDRLDGDLAWLESLGAPVVWEETGNPLTTGRRYDPEELTAALAARAGELRVGEPLREPPAGVPLVLATGGFQGDRELVRRHVTPAADELVLRANPWSAGDGLRLGLAHGGTTTAGLDEFYGRAMPAPPARIGPHDFVAAQQLYARLPGVEVVNEAGERYEPRTWSEIDVVQWIARQPRARAWYLVAPEALADGVRDVTVAKMIDAARRAGGPVSERPDGRLAVEVVAGITTTLGGLAVDERAQVSEGLYAAGADVGGTSTGGYASGLAAALVLGRVAAESALDR